MNLKDYAQRNMEEGQYVALISLDVKGAFRCRLVAWNTILIKDAKVTKELINLCGSNFNGRSTVLILKSRKE